MGIQQQPRPAADAGERQWLWLSCFMLVIAVYFVGRYGGLWAEADSAAFSRYIRVATEQGRLSPESPHLYPNGYGFQALSAFVIGLTGLPVAALQQLVYPLFTVMLVLPTWVLYRELTGDARGATLASLLLFTQPEFLFVILRSSHEKFLRLMLIVCLFLLVRSFREYRRPAVLTIYVLLFYLAAFAMIANNNLLANSFFAAVAIALGLGWLMGRLGRTPFGEGGDITRRFFYISLICLGLVYLFVFYIYPPARLNLLVMNDIWERIAALFLDVEREPNNAYTQVATGWVSLPAYFVLSSANWFLLLSSALIWLGQSWRWLGRGEAPGGTSGRILWLLYSAFALQGALSILADASGGIAGNFQHRIFPSFSIVAVAVVGAALARWRPARWPRLLNAGLLAGLGAITLLSAMKATNEPLFSNKWMFYRQEELQAIRWGDDNLRDGAIWTEVDERLTAAYLIVESESANNNQIRAFRLLPTTRMLLSSDVSRLRSARLGSPLPIPYDAQRVYDNGTAELYRLRPATPFQR